MNNNLPPGVKYIDTISDKESFKSYNRFNKDEGEESVDELLPINCIHNEDIWLCHEINKCLNCKDESLSST